MSGGAVARQDREAYRELTAWAGRDKDKLRQVAADRGYKPGWGYHRARALEAKVSGAPIPTIEEINQLFPVD